jgi:uncharacterized protein YjbJ (UPF0337 family)
VFTFIELGKGWVSPGDPAGADVDDENTEVLMGLADKAKDKAEELAGKAKAAVGDATDNPDLEAEGRVQESKADLKQAGENVKDSGDDVAGALRAASGAAKGDDRDTMR